MRYGLYPHILGQPSGRFVVGEAYCPLALKQLEPRDMWPGVLGALALLSVSTSTFAFSGKQDCFCFLGPHFEVPASAGQQTHQLNLRLILIQYPDNNYNILASSDDPK